MGVEGEEGGAPRRRGFSWWRFLPESVEGPEPQHRCQSPWCPGSQVVWEEGVERRNGHRDHRLCPPVLPPCAPQLNQAHSLTHSLHDHTPSVSPTPTLRPPRPSLPPQEVGPSSVPSAPSGCPLLSEGPSLTALPDSTLQTGTSTAQAPAPGQLARLGPGLTLCFPPRPHGERPLSGLWGWELPVTLLRTPPHPLVPSPEAPQPILPQGPSCLLAPVTTTGQRPGPGRAVGPPLASGSSSPPPLPLPRHCLPPLLPLPCPPAPPCTSSAPLQPAWLSPCESAGSSGHSSLPPQAPVFPECAASQAFSAFGQMWGPAHPHPHPSQPPSWGSQRADPGGPTSPACLAPRLARIPTCESIPGGAGWQEGWQ